jgi:hypothetical protein
VRCAGSVLAAFGAAPPGWLVLRLHAPCREGLVMRLSHTGAHTQKHAVSMRKRALAEGAERAGAARGESIGLDVAVLNQ